MIKSRLTLTLLGACAVLAAAWPFRYQLYLHLPSEPVHRLVVKDGLYWLKGKVYSGRITETDVLKGGGLITITPVIDGVREGRSVTFDDGEPVATAEWVAGKLEGPAVRTSRRTGRVLEEAFYKDGRLDGERRLSGDDGTLLRSETHARGVLDGMVREFAPDGTKRLEAEYRSGKLEGRTRRFNEKGVLVEETTYLAGVRQGPFALFFEETGEPAVFGNYMNDSFEGRVTTVRPDGTREIRSYVRGVEKGPVEIYARDGKRIDPEAVQELAADAPVEVQEAEEHLQERDEP